MTSPYQANDLSITSQTLLGSVDDLLSSAKEPGLEQVWNPQYHVISC